MLKDRTRECPQNLHLKAFSKRLRGGGEQGRARESKGTNVNAGGLAPLILRGVVDVPMRTWFNLGGNAG